MREYLLNKVILSKVNYEDCTTFEKGLLDINHIDSIKNIKISENLISFSVKRTIKFMPENSLALDSEWECAVSCNEIVSKDIFINDIKLNRLYFLNFIASKISLLISNITSNTPLGSIVTIPSFNLNSLIIE